MNYHIPKGVFDILPNDPDPEGKWRDSHLWQYLEKIIRELTTEYGFREIRTPLFEATDLFTRSVGSSSDIVKKEMYTFLDRGNRSLSLRPEGTAPVMRAYIEKNLSQNATVQKFFYIAPMFRYERQQAGRYRQHHQFGVEVVGGESPYQDVETIQLLWSLYQRLGLKNLTLHIHSIGTKETRTAFRTAFQEYLLPHFQELSEDSQERFHLNPLRILDSKNAKDQQLVANAPRLLEYLDLRSKAHFESVLSILEKISIPFQINHKLVRGLDYYNNTVFEITSSELGAQNSLGGGGRYDGLLQELGGPDMPAFGFGAGLERILQTMLGQHIPLPPRPHPLIVLISLGEEAVAPCFELLCHLRQQRIPAEMDFQNKKLKNSLRYANALQARFIAVIGTQELVSRQLELKEMESGITEKLSLDSLTTRLTYELQKNT